MFCRFYVSVLPTWGCHRTETLNASRPSWKTAVTTKANCLFCCHLVASLGTSAICWHATWGQQGCVVSGGSAPYNDENLFKILGLQFKFGILVLFESNNAHDFIIKIAEFVHLRLHGCERLAMLQRCVRADESSYGEANRWTCMCPREALWGFFGIKGHRNKCDLTWNKPLKCSSVQPFYWSMINLTLHDYTSTRNL